MFRIDLLSIIRNLFTVHSAMAYVIKVCRQLSSRNICSCSCEISASTWFYYKEICYDVRSHESKIRTEYLPLNVKMCMTTAPSKVIPYTHTLYEMRYTKCRWHLIRVLVFNSTVWIQIYFKIFCSGHCLCRKTKHLIWVDESTGFWKIVTWGNFTWTISFHFLILWVYCL
jgi:hypothetical protein